MCAVGAQPLEIQLPLVLHLLRFKREGVIAFTQPQHCTGQFNKYQSRCWLRRLADTQGIAVWLAFPPCQQNSRDSDAAGLPRGSFGSNDSNLACLLASLRWDAWDLGGGQYGNEDGVHVSFAECGVRIPPAPCHRRCPYTIARIRDQCKRFRRGLQSWPAAVAH